MATDFNGTNFKNLAEMCASYHIALRTYEDRMQKGWSQKEALTTPARCGPHRKITDPDGVEFSSVSELCRAHSINRNVYKSRIAIGWTMEEALRGYRQKQRNLPDEVSPQCDRM